MNQSNFNITAVERDTGLSKDVLRVWERRYGFPNPDRDQYGERIYPLDQVDRLRLIKRLMDQGFRPGKLISLSVEELASLAPRRPRVQKNASAETCGDLNELLTLIKQHDSNGYLQAMQQRLARQGLQSFVQDTVAPITKFIGEAWEDGKIEVFEEHLFTELTKRLLRQIISSLPSGSGGPRILLTSVPNEQHILGLLMAEALFTLEGAECIPLGTEMPVLEIARAAQAHQVDIVALSFSIAFPQRQIPGLLQQLRQAMPTAIEIWIGGAGISRISSSAGIRAFLSLDEATQAIAQLSQQSRQEPGHTGANRQPVDSSPQA